MGRRVSRGRVIAAALAAGALVLAFYLWRDLNLPRTVDVRKLPDVVVESLTFERTIEGRDWLVQVTRAEHHEGLITAQDVDIEVAAAGERSRVTARSGEFTQESANFELSAVEGALFLKDRSVDWSTPHARYDASADLWTFESGVAARDGSVVVSGESGTIARGGVFTLGRGAEARWNESE